MKLLLSIQIGKEHLKREAKRSYVQNVLEIIVSKKNKK